MPLVNIKLIHKACKAYIDDPILKPFQPIVLTAPQSSMDLNLGYTQKTNIIPGVSIVQKKNQIAQEMLQAHSVLQVADILDRRDHGGMTNREFLQTTNSVYLSWYLLRLQISLLVQNIKTSSDWQSLWLSFPITVFAVNAGMIYWLGIAFAAGIIYAVWRACNALVQIYQSSAAFANRSQQLIAELDTATVQNYNSADINELLQQFDLVYDEDGNWIDRILSQPAEWQDKKSKDSSLILHALLACQNPNYSYATIKKLQRAIDMFSNQKYMRNSSNTTPMHQLNHSDIYGFRHLLDVHDTQLFQEQFNKIDRFLASVSTNRRNTKGLLLLEGASGTGKSQTVIDYIGKSKHFEVHQWEAGSEGDRWVGGLEGRASTFFKKIMTQASYNPQKKFAIYLDNLDVLCASKGKDTKEYYRALAGQFSSYIEKVRQESPNIIVVATTRSALHIDGSLLELSDRVRFPLPSEEQRRSLLQYAFVDTLVSDAQLQQLVQITEGWAHRSLVAIASSLDKTKVTTEEDMEVALAQIRINLERDFTGIYPHTQIMLPKFLKTNSFLNYQIVTPKPIQDCLNRLKKYLQHPKCYERTPMHALFYGPPGGGKTTAARNFCEEMNLPFLVIKAGISASDLIKAFEAVNEFKYALVFIDEIDSFPHTGELLKQMDGFNANNTILIGATNDGEKVIAAGKGALGDRFHFKILVPGLTQEQRGNFIKWKTTIELERSEGVLQVDKDLAEQLSRESDCLRLAEDSKTLSMRAVSNHISHFWSEKRCDAISSSHLGSVTVSLEEFSEEFIQVSESQIIKSLR